MSDGSRIVLARTDDYWCARFTAMAGPCEILLDCTDRAQAQALATIGADEVWRIEAKFSRYRSGNIVDAINTAAGKPVAVDAETRRLLGYADQCFQLSEGRFDITSGVLRRVWQFDGGSRVPSDAQLQDIRSLIGWEKVSLSDLSVQLPANMELDFGGIGKEYAADAALALLCASDSVPVLVNLGGDLACSGLRANGSRWQVGIEHAGQIDTAAQVISLASGALASSGDTRRYVMHAGKRLSHVLDPRNGWPVEGAPHAVTVAAPHCTEAGMLATFALLHGTQAEEFLRVQSVRHWVQWE